MAITMRAEARKNGTKSERKALRAKGKIPGVLYGSKVTSTPIAIDEKELMALLRTNPHAIIEMELPQLGKQPVMINEVQRDNISRNVLHVDFHQINMDEPVVTTVRLEFVGEPAGVVAGGMLQIQHHEIEVRCLPVHIPAVIEVDISHLVVGTNIHVSELKVPDTIEIKTEGDHVLAAVLAPQKDAAEAEDAPEAGTAAEAKAADAKASEASDKS
jgi:large subunit ribosomal protein L25